MGQPPPPPPPPREPGPATARPPLPDPGPTTAPPPLPDPGPTTAPPPLPDGAGGHPPPDEDAGTASRALHHTTEQSRTYPCTACGGELHFDIETQLLKCQHCGNTHELVEVDRDVVERDLRQALELVRAGAVRHTSHFLDDEKEVVCQNCGGHTTFTGSLTADKCPYCATPIQRDDVHDAPERLPVDAVLPFRVDEGEARELIEKWINSRWFAPSEFKTYNRTGSFRSVYMAYFTYDARTFTTYAGQRGDHYTVTVGSGDNRRTEVRTRWRSVSGAVQNAFDDVAVFANDGFEKDRIDQLEPWPTQQAKPYSPEYVAGHLSRTYDHDVEECFAEASNVMQAQIQSTVRRDIGGDVQRISRMNVNWRDMTYKHVLLPIWLLTVIYDQRPFQVYINGVTGEVHGNRPYSKVKIAAAVAFAVVLLVVVVLIVNSSGGGGSG